MAALDAVTLLRTTFGPNAIPGAPATIISRASAGLIAAKCDLMTIVSNGRRKENSKISDCLIDQLFWGNDSAIRSSNWNCGDFTFIQSDDYGITTIKTFNVKFCDEDLRKIHGVPSKATGVTPGDKVDEKRPNVSDADLKRWYAVFVGVHPNPVSEAFALLSARAMFPDKAVSREKVRDLRGPQPIGKPKSSR